MLFCSFESLDFHPSNFCYFLPPCETFLAQNVLPVSSAVMKELIVPNVKDPSPSFCHVGINSSACIFSLSSLA